MCRCAVGWRGARSVELLRLAGFASRPLFRFTEPRFDVNARQVGLAGLAQIADEALPGLSTVSATPPGDALKASALSRLR